jgi:hypothetical protein
MSRTSSIVIDLRRKRPWFCQSDMPAWLVYNAARVDLAALLARDVYLPAPRRRVHSGYPPQDGSMSGGYYSGFETQAHELWRAPGGAVAG